MKEKYFFVDNWDGNIRYFNTLRDAKKAAKLSTGVCVTIIETKKTNKGINVVCSGWIPS